MISRLKAMFSPDPGVSARLAHDDRQTAAAALLVEAARMDEPFTEVERASVRELLQRRFGLDGTEADDLLSRAADTQAEASQLLRFTRIIKDSFGHRERVELIEMLWEVVYADGQAHAYEANLLRRVCGLLYVPDTESGAARKRVLARLGLAED